MANDKVMIVVSKGVRERLKSLKWDMRASSIDAVIERLIDEHDSALLSKQVIE